MKTDAQKRACAKYRAARAQFTLTISHEQKAAWKARAEALGISLTAYIIAVVEADLKKSMDE